MAKVIINQKQFNMIVSNISENISNEHKIKELFNFLSDNYQVTKGTYKKGGEFHERVMVVNKINEDLMTIKSLYKYVKYKFINYSDEFIKQVIRDWSSGYLDGKNYNLSKNVIS